MSRQPYSTEHAPRCPVCWHRFGIALKAGACRCSGHVSDGKFVADIKTLGTRGSDAEPWKQNPDPKPWRKRKMTPAEPGMKPQVGVHSCRWY